jgi:hypothetical protein
MNRDDDGPIDMELLEEFLAEHEREVKIDRYIPNKLLEHIRQWIEEYNLYTDKDDPRRFERMVLANGVTIDFSALDRLLSGGARSPKTWKDDDRPPDTGPLDNWLMTYHRDRYDPDMLLEHIRKCIAKYDSYEQNPHEGIDPDILVCAEAVIWAFQALDWQLLDGGRSPKAWKR